MVHAGSRCTANLVQQGHPGSSFPNLYLNSLFRCYVLGELERDRIKRPPYYSLEFFSIIREAEDGGEDTLAITTRGWQKRIMERGVTHQKDVESGLPEIIQTGQEMKLKQANWGNIWLISRACHHKAIFSKSLAWVFFCCLFMYRIGLKNFKNIRLICEENKNNCECDQGLE